MRAIVLLPVSVIAADVAAVDDVSLGVDASRLHATARTSSRVNAFEVAI